MPGRRGRALHGTSVHDPGVTKSPAREGDTTRGENNFAYRGLDDEAQLDIGETRLSKTATRENKKATPADAVLDWKRPPLRQGRLETLLNCATMAGTRKPSILGRGRGREGQRSRGVAIVKSTASCYDARRSASISSLQTHGRSSDLREKSA